MKRTPWPVALILLAAGATGFALAQDPQEPELTPEEAQELAMKAMQLGQPGPEHALFESLVGDWDVEMKFWANTTGHAMVFKGVSRNELVLGGRFLRVTTETEIMGTRADSIGYLGFDRRHEEFTTLGLDTAGTYWVTGMGPRDPETGVITMRGEDHDPVFGFKQVYDFVMDFPDDDTYRTSVIFHDKFNAPDGPYKKVEVTSRRKK